MNTHRLKSKKEWIVSTFKEAREYERNYIGVVFELPDHPGRELIINHSRNFDIKEEYYINNYDDDLCNIRNQEVKIVNLFSFNKMEDISSIDLSYTSTR